MKKWIFRLLPISLLCIVLILAACSPGNSVIEPTITETNTDTPSTATPSPTKTPTNTPLPTEIPEQGELLFTKTFPLLPQIIRSDDESLLFTHDGFTFQVLDGENYSSMYKSEINASGNGKIIQVSPDGSMVVLHNQTYAELLYWQESGLSIRLGYSEDISSAAFSNSQNHVVYKSKSDCIQTLNLENRKNSACYPLSESSKNGFFTEPAISPDGSKIAAGYRAAQENYLYIWDTMNEDILFIIHFPYNEINCLGFHPTDQTLIAADNGGHLTIIDTNTGEVIKEHSAFDRDIHQIEYSEDGKTIILYLPLNKIKQFNLMNSEITIKHANINDPYTEKLLLEGYLYPNQLPALSFHPDGTKLAIAQGNIQILDLEDQVITNNIFEDKAIPNANIIFSRNGKYLASINYFGNIHIWDLEIPGWEQIISNSIRYDFANYEYYQKDSYRWDEGLFDQLPIEFSPDNEEIAFMNGWKMNVWNIDNWTINQKNERYYSSHYLTDFSYSTDGNTIYSINNINEDVRISSGHNGDIISEANLTSSSTVDSVPAAITDSFFARVEFSVGNTIIKIVDVSTNTSYKIPLPSEIETILSINFSPTGHLIALIDSTGKVYIWQTSTGDLLFASDIPMSTTASAIRADGQLFADISTEAHKSVLRVWSMENYIDESIFSEEIVLPSQTKDENIINIENIQQIEQVFSTGIGDIIEVVWGKGNDQIHIFTSLGYFRLNPSTLEIEYADENREIQIEDGFVFPDQRVFATTYLPENMMQIWDIDYKGQLVEFVGAEPVTMSPDHQSILFFNGDFGLTQWDTMTGQVRQNFKCNNNIFSEPVFSSNGKYLAAIDSAHEVCIWETSTAALPTVIENENEPYVHLQFSSLGDKLYAITNSNIEILNIATKSIEEKFQFEDPASDNQITDFQVSPSEDSLALAIDDSLWIYDLPTFEIISKLDSLSSIESFSYNADGSAIVIQNEDGVLAIHSLTDETQIISKRISIPEINKLIPLLDNTIAVQFAKEYTVFQPESGDIISSAKLESGQIIDISPTGSQYIVSNMGSYDVMALKTNMVIYSIKDILIQDSKEATNISKFTNLDAFFNHDGTQVFVYNNEKLWIIDNEIKSILAIYELQNINQATLSKDDTLIILITNEEKRIVYDLQNDELLHVSSCYACNNNKYVFSPNNQWVVYTGRSAWGPNFIKVDNKDDSYYPSHIFLDEYSTLNTSAFSPDGELLILGKENGKLEIINAESHESIHLIKDQASEVTLTAFTSDGKYIVTASDKGVIHIWGIEK